MRNLMKASYFKEFGELEDEQFKTGELELPEPGEGEVLVKIKAAGINPVDAAIAKGMLNEMLPAEFPVIPGWDMAGVVEKRGHAARRFDEGDEVYAYARRPQIKWGTFAEYTVIPESYLASKPETLSMEEAAGIPLAGLTAYQSLFDAADLSEKDTVAILGASGGVGSIAIQLAKAEGANVIGVASEKNHTFMKELGADHVIDYSAGDVGESIKKIYPDGIDVIFHCSRGNSLDQCLQASVLKKGGRLVSITKSQPEISDDIAFNYVFVEPNATELDHLRQLADAGKLKIEVSGTYELDEVGEAMRQIEQLHTRGKLVIKP
ncbi:NADP-dependent oxidoreductase [Balneola sp. MJW-20]|uniref:NADP-dependent oxidoreductase n=1 Tax=Gracilimonas aurantiaca TaxID=3234185 RepID=UPI003467996F